MARAVANERLMALGAALALLGGCAALLGPPPDAAATRPTKPDDADLVALVPAGIATVIDVNMATMRGSGWTAPALAVPDARARAVKIEALGYDDVADVDRVVYAVTAAAADTPTLVLVQGRFHSERIAAAFRTRWPAATLDRWRGATVLTSGENALGFITARTFASGTPGAVRAAIDRAFGVGVAGATDGAIGLVRRALLPEVTGASPALVVTVAIDDQMRARIGDAAPVPRELRQVGVRADLGETLDLTALGVLDDHAAAALLARRLSELLTNPVTRLGARAMGLGPLVDSTRITIDGARVRVRASALAEQRGDVAAALQTLASSLRGATGAGGPGSW